MSQVGAQQFKSASFRVIMKSKLIWIYVAVLLTTLIALAVLFGLVRFTQPSQRASSAALTVEQPITRETLLTAVNQKRVAAGVPALTIDERLNQSAQVVADGFILDNSPHVDAEGVRGVTIALQYAPNCRQTSENISWHYSSLSGVIEGWAQSPSHYAAMVNGQYSTTGFGIAPGNIIIQHFCSLT